MINCIVLNTKIMAKLFSVQNFSKSNFSSIYKANQFFVFLTSIILCTREIEGKSYSVVFIYIQICKNLYMREKNERKMNSVSSF